MAAWTLVPDKLEKDEYPATRLGVFGSTLLAFFLVEMGDKTQLATVGLAAQYDAFALVVAGTTLGMMIANVPAVIVGERLASRIPVTAVQRCAAVMLAAVGVMILLAF